jgi:hypothetical protein
MAKFEVVLFVKVPHFRSFKVEAENEEEAKVKAIADAIEANKQVAAQEDWDVEWSSRDDLIEVNECSELPEDVQF